jgi:three-Cys-motif partner protein
MTDRAIPAAYADRIQTYLKHRVLAEYLRTWAHKLGSTARFGTRRLWYVDCFAGLWRSQDADGADTSAEIGLRALEEAIDTWRGERGAALEGAAIFVEADPGRAARLREMLGKRESRVTTEVLEGEFGAHAAAIQQRLGAEAAFLFVDPTGWKGADMAYIAELAGRPYRDVLVNVMFDYLNRWIGAPLPFLREQLQRFFGLRTDEMPPDGLDEPGLLTFYRSKLKERCGVRWAADLAIPYGDRERTFFRLVVGGHDPEVLRVFRDVEEAVVGKEAGSVRDKARRRTQEKRTGQTSLALGTPTMDERYKRMRDADMPRAIDAIGRLVEDGQRRFAELWPSVLEGHHVTVSALAAEVKRAADAGRLVVEGLGKRERTVKDDNLVRKP